MYWVASVTIAANHRELEGQVLTLDGHLRANEGATFRLGFAADILGIHRELLSRLLQLYETEGTVKQEVAYVCPQCDGFLERIAGEGDLWCDLCEKSFTYRGRGPIGEKVWRVQADAPKTGWIPRTEEVSGEVQPGLATVIQFIAGDRGGGPRPQLMIPREEKIIRDAVALGSRREAFSFAPSVYSASIDDVIACNRAKPAIVHFAGHGADRRLILVLDRDLLVEPHQLQQEHLEILFQNFLSRVRMIVFNTCRSVELARHLTDKNVVDVALGVAGEIADDHAIRFAGTLYRQLSDGLSVQRAFGMAGLQVANADAASKPQLLSASGVNPERVFFAPPAH